MSENESNLQKEEELIQRVEKAAREGAREGSKGGFGKGAVMVVTGIIGRILMPVIVILVVLALASRFQNPLSSLFEREEPVENHDLTLENHGLFGYTAADFSEAVLGQASQHQKLEIYSRDITDVAELTDTGFANFKVLSKCQLITYHGKAVYTVDLGELDASSIQLDESNYTVKLLIPHAVLEPINIPSENIEFGDVEKGLLAFGDIKASPEDIAKVETEAKTKMNDKLEAENAAAEADRYARLSILEIYQPVIKGISPVYSLEVETVQ